MLELQEMERDQVLSSQSHVIISTCIREASGYRLLDS